MSIDPLTERKQPRVFPNPLDTSRLNGMTTSQRTAIRRDAAKRSR